MSIPRVGYRAIAADLQLGIENGEYPAESKLPTYAELAYIYNVSVTTAQRAVLLLQERGLAVGVQGRGVYVAEQS